MSTTPQLERFPLGQQSAEQQAAFADVEKKVNELFGSNFRLKDEEGNLAGPFGTLSYTPNGFTPYVKYMYEINATAHFSAKERELATLATCSVTKADFVIYAHKIIGQGAGLTKEQVDKLVEGVCPDDLQGREKLICETALHMAKNYGKMDDERFETVSAVIGRDGMSALAQIVGAFLLNGVLVNVANVRTPSA